MHKSPDNYFAKKITKVENLKHFHHKSFSEFQQAVKGNKTIIDVRMDISREWLLSDNVPRNIQMWMIFVSWVPALCTIFYLVSAFVINDLWLLLYSLIPILMLLTCTPIPRKLFKTYWILGALLLIFWYLRGFGFTPPLIYSIPLVFVLFAILQLYEGAAGLVKKIIMEDEKALCFFWKNSALVLHMNHINTVLTQDYIKHKSTTIYWKDIKKDKEEYIKLTQLLQNKK